MAAINKKIRKRMYAEPLCHVLRFLRRLLLVPCLSLSCLSLAVADSKTLTGDIFGTSYTIKARDADPIDKDRLLSEITTRLDQIDTRMSTYRDDSDVSRFNRAESNTWFPVHAETVKVIELAQAISVETGGSFDITVGPAVNLWNFGARASDAFTPPNGDVVVATLRSVGYKKLEYQLDPPSLRKSVFGLHVDLSAIAKGYAVDAVCKLLEEFDHYMVEIGGEVRSRGTRRDGSPWRIGLEAPKREERRIDSIVSLENESMATSGDYRNFFEHDGVTYSHTIDPKTGRPVQHDLAAVSVIAETCARADALATALLVMGLRDGLNWARSNKVKAMFLSRTDGMFVRQQTRSFPKSNILPHAVEGANPNSNFLQLFVVTAVVFGIAILAMSMGTIIANRRLQGSCGGLAGLRDANGQTSCDMCTTPSPECSGQPEQ